MGGASSMSALKERVLELAEIAKECPIAMVGGAIEIREFAGFV